MDLGQGRQPHGHYGPDEPVLDRGQRAAARAGAKRADSASQLAFFVLPSLCAGDGTGAAEIADDTIDALVGGGTEKQFRFQGVLAQQKPFRDWLTEILACGLGYFTWSSASSSSAAASTPPRPRRSRLALPAAEPAPRTHRRRLRTPGDRFRRPGVPVSGQHRRIPGQEHAAYYGRAGAPLTAAAPGGLRDALPGLAPGGRAHARGDRRINPAEWRNARNASWKTTVLALDTRSARSSRSPTRTCRHERDVLRGGRRVHQPDRRPLDTFIVNKES